MVHLIAPSGLSLWWLTACALAMISVQYAPAVGPYFRVTFLTFRLAAQLSSSRVQFLRMLGAANRVESLNSEDVHAFH